MDKNRQIGLLALGALCIGMVYTGGGPVYDDHYLFGDEMMSMDILNHWTDPSLGGRVGIGYYRPLAMTLMSLLGSVAAVHVAAALLHAASTLMIRQELGGDNRANFAAALFAVHPLCSEALGWASSFFDILALFFGLACWRLLGQNKTWQAGGALLLGLLCKESALAPPLALAMVGRIGLIQSKGLFAAAIVYGTMRWQAALDSNPWNIAGKAGLIDEALLWPIGSLLIPTPLTPLRDILAIPDWSWFCGAVVAVILVRLAWTNKAMRSGITLIFISPILALPPTLDSYFAAERYAYLSVMGLALAIGSSEVLRHKNYQKWLAYWPMLFLLFGPIHYKRAQAWKTDSNLFAAATQAMPNSSFAWHYHGYVLMGEGHYNDAATAFLLAVETGHPHPDDRLNRLIALTLANKPTQALLWAQKGPKENLSALHLSWWGRAAVEAGEHELALQLFAPLHGPEGIDGPDWVEAYWNKAIAEQKTKTVLE